MRPDRLRTLATALFLAGCVGPGPVEPAHSPREIAHEYGEKASKDSKDYQTCVHQNALTYSLDRGNITTQPSDLADASLANCESQWQRLSSDLGVMFEAEDPLEPDRANSYASSSANQARSIARGAALSTIVNGRHVLSSTPQN